MRHWTCINTTGSCANAASARRIICSDDEDYPPCPSCGHILVEVGTVVRRSPIGRWVRRILIAFACAAVIAALDLMLLRSRRWANAAADSFQIPQKHTPAPTTLPLALAIAQPISSPIVLQPTITPPASVTVETGGTLSVSVACTPADAELIADAATLPPGVTVNAQDHLMSGIATAAGDYRVKLTVRAPRGQASAVLPIKVLAKHAAVEPRQQFSLFVGHDFEIAIRSPAGTTAYRIEAGQLPDGISFNDRTGDFHGKALASGKSELVISTLSPSGWLVGQERICLTLTIDPADCQAARKNIEQHMSDVSSLAKSYFRMDAGRSISLRTPEETQREHTRWSLELSRDSLQMTTAFQQLQTLPAQAVEIALAELKNAGSCPTEQLDWFTSHWKLSDEQKVESASAELRDLGSKLRNMEKATNPSLAP